MNKLFLYFSAVVATIGSAYSTYLGLSVSMDSQYSAILFSFVSATAALALSFIFGRTIQTSDFSPFRKLLTICIVLLVTFFGSTLWSVVGIASEDIFKAYTKDVVVDIEKILAEERALAKAQEASRTVGTLLELVTLIHENALQGRYTGSNEEGPLSRTFGLLRDDISIQNKAFAERVATIAEIVAEINVPLARIKNANDLNKRGEFNSSVAQINALLVKLDSVVYVPILVSISELIHYAISTVKSFQEHLKYSSVNLALINSEINTLSVQSKRLAENIKNFNKVKYVDAKKLQVPITSLAFMNFFSIIHWWMFCVTIDLLPMMALSAALREDY